MGKDFDAAEFIDRDLEQDESASHRPATGRGTPGAHPSNPRDPNAQQEEVEAYKKRISELAQEKERLEKKSLIIEESRRKQLEFRQGRQEMMVKLTRAIEILDENHKLREQELRVMRKNVDELKERLAIITDLQPTEWPEKEFESCLNDALRDLENSRMEWNRQLAKYPKLLRAALSGPEEVILPEAADGTPLEKLPLNGHNLKYLCKLGIALTWPLALAIIVVGILFLIFN
jgi:hypothetical protein